MRGEERRGEERKGKDGVMRGDCQAVQMELPVGCGCACRVTTSILSLEQALLLDASLYNNFVHYSKRRGHVRLTVAEETVAQDE